LTCPYTPFQIFKFLPRLKPQRRTHTHIEADLGGFGLILG